VEVGVVGVGVLAELLGAVAEVRVVVLAEPVIDVAGLVGVLVLVLVLVLVPGAGSGREGRKRRREPQH